MKSFRHLIRLFLIWIACPGFSAIGSAAAFPRSAPEAQGVSSAAILAVIEALDEQLDTMNSFMLLRHGRVVAEGWWAPYDAESNHQLYSLSKSFTSTAVGLAVAEGRLTVDDPVLKFFPEDAPADPSQNLRSMRVSDLLRMSAGHQTEPSAAADQLSARAFLAHPVPHKPGTHFQYNTAATFMLSAILEKQTGEPLMNYLRPRLFDPLGIAKPSWDTNWQGIALGGYGLRVRTEDIARLGQLYLQKGAWNGKPLLRPEWVEAATSLQTSNGSDPASDWAQGYGYQFWRCRHGAYRGDGAFGQYCLVLPEQDAVVVITSGVRNMQAVLDVIWDRLLPAFESEALPPNPAAAKRLQDKLARLVVRPAGGKPSSPLAASVHGRNYLFPDNDRNLASISLLHDGATAETTLVIRSKAGESRQPCGFQQWRKGRGPFGNLENEPVAATFGWVDDATCAVRICAYETPFYRDLTFRFEGDQVFFNEKANVGFGPTTRPQLVGHAESR